ncbi:MAG: sigma-70 family RNA polymerase sigma factor [Pseudomonadota bacterium]
MMIETVVSPAQDEDEERAHRVLLVRVAHDRDINAMQALYESFRPRLVRFMRRLTPDMTLIEEAYNDVMLIVWNKASQYESRSKVSSWIFTIAYRACLRLVKRSKKRNDMIHLTDNESLDSATTEQAQTDHENRQLAAAVQRLSAKHRIVIELCYFEGYSIQEIGEIIRCPVNTVKTRLHHARKRIKTLLADSANPLGATGTNEGGLS